MSAAINPPTKKKGRAAGTCNGPDDNDSLGGTMSAPTVTPPAFDDYLADFPPHVQVAFGRFVDKVKSELTPAVLEQVLELAPCAAGSGVEARDAIAAVFTLLQESRMWRAVTDGLDWRVEQDGER